MRHPMLHVKPYNTFPSSYTYNTAPYSVDAFQTHSRDMLPTGTSYRTGPAVLDAAPARLYRVRPRSTGGRGSVPLLY